MIQLIALLILNSLVIGGIFNATQYTIDPYGKTRGEILGFLGRFSYEKLPIFIHTPLFGCMKCMASIWSFPYLLIYGEDWRYIGYIFALSGLNAIYERFTD